MRRATRATPKIVYTAKLKWKKKNKIQERENENKRLEEEPAQHTANMVF